MKAIFSLIAAACGALPLFAGSATEAIETARAPKALGAYSQGLKLDLDQMKHLVFVSGQVAIDPATGKMIDENIEAATRRTLDNVEAILQDAGSDWNHVIRMDVFLQNLDRDWDGMNAVYSERFSPGQFPVRQTVGVAMDPDTLVEISCIAYVPRET